MGFAITERSDLQLVRARGSAGRSAEIAWDIGPDWQIVADPSRTSEVEVRFEPAGDGTRVQLTHRHLERHGAGWEGVREGVNTDQGWPLYLRNYQALTLEENA